MIEALEDESVSCEIVCLVDLDVRPGVSSDEGGGDEWPRVLEKVLAANILVIGEFAGGLIDIGFTVPGQAWTYWNRGPGPGKSYLEDEAGREWSHTTGRAAASNLAAAARALRERPIPAPPSE